MTMVVFHLQPKADLGKVQLVGSTEHIAFDLNFAYICKKTKIFLLLNSPLPTTIVGHVL